VFDRYWNSEWVSGLPRRPAAAAAAQRSSAEQEALTELESDARARLILAGQRSWAAELERLPRMLKAGRSSVHTDSPSRAETVHNHTPEAFRALLRSAQREIRITNAYVIPDDAFMSDLREMAARGVAVYLLTNSLASHDVPAVNAHYEVWRAAILEDGAYLYELRPDAALKPRLVDTAPVRGKFVGLHVKAMVIDRQRCFIGSMNLDPRSEVINSEMGVLIDSPALAAELADDMAHDMTGVNSWRVTRDAGGALHWSDDRGTVDRAPARSIWQRVQNVFFKFFPRDLY
jgi:putative cardiolipin synthase